MIVAVAGSGSETIWSNGIPFVASKVTEHKVTEHRLPGKIGF